MVLNEQALLFVTMIVGDRGGGKFRNRFERRTTTGLSTLCIRDGLTFTVEILLYLVTLYAICELFLILVLEV